MKQESVEISAKDLCKLCSMLRQLKRVDVGAEHVRGGKTHTLANLRPAVTARGNASVRRIGTLEDGCDKWYGGNYLFVVTAFIAGSQRIPIPDVSTR